MFGEDAHLEAAYEERWVVEDIVVSDNLFDDEDCICGEPADGEMAEVYDPKNPEVAVLCHVSCIPEGYQIA
jgi:hypothetical protein